ncbi:MAG: hypothetical protein QOG82_956 [Actinomycetota bacterium]|nr:hypothetical protein [Actinomycetota bacterium]
MQRGWMAALAHQHFVLGDEVAVFEREFAAFCGADHCVGVGNGTDALELSLRALGIGPGDGVIVPANSFVATAEAVLRAGAELILVDVDPDSYLIDTAAVEAAMGPSVAAVIAVHLFGQMAEVERLDGIAGPVVLEDAAQAHGATRHGRPPGDVGSLAAWSFYPSKNLGAFGDAGAVTTHDQIVADRVRRMRNHGGESRNTSDELGWNSRLDTLQAIVLSAKLAHLDDWNRQRAAAARRYDELLAGVDGVVPPHTLPGNQHVWHIYVVQVPDRDEVLQVLRSSGIEAAVHYPVPIHRQPAFRKSGPAGAFPVAEAAARRMLSLPIYPGITADQQERVVTALRRALGAR